MSTYFDKTKNGNNLFQQLNNVEGRVAEIEQNGTGGGSSASGVTHDVPQTLGEYYCVRKAQEVVEAYAYLTNTLVTIAKTASQTQQTYNAGDVYNGIPYSSTRKWNTFVPNNVSFETYFTALSDPNSYAYTIHPHSAAREYLYYGLVCTEFACFCLGIKAFRHTNWEMFDIPGIERVQTQDAQAMRIGYIINCDRSGVSQHVRVCIGVTRTNGVVTSITLADSTSAVPNARIAEVSAEDFNGYLTNGYVILKYNRLEENTYEPWMFSRKMPFYNKNIMPAKGNKANWSNTENVVINVLDAASYTDYIIYKDGVQYATSPFSATSLNLGVLPYGKYSMVLTDGTNKSAPVEWIVVDMQMSVAARSGGILRFTFSSKNAVPLACCWALPSDYMILITQEVDKKDIHNGYKDTQLNTEPCACNGLSLYSGRGSAYEAYHTQYAAGTWKIRPRMLFETEFGIITTDWGSSDITYVD